MFESMQKSFKIIETDFKKLIHFENLKKKISFDGVMSRDNNLYLLA